MWLAVSVLYLDSTLMASAKHRIRRVPWALFSYTGKKGTNFQKCVPFIFYCSNYCHGVLKLKALPIARYSCSHERYTLTKLQEVTLSNIFALSLSWDIVFWKWQQCTKIQQALLWKELVWQLAQPIRLPFWQELKLVMQYIPGQVSSKHRVLPLLDSVKRSLTQHVIATQLICI